MNTLDETLAVIELFCDENVKRMYTLVALARTYLYVLIPLKEYIGIDWSSQIKYNRVEVQKAFIVKNSDGESEIYIDVSIYLEYSVGYRRHQKITNAYGQKYKEVVDIVLRGLVSNIDVNKLVFLDLYVSK